MDITQWLIIIAGVAIAALLIIIVIRLSARRRVKAMSPEERDLHYAQQAHKKRVSELKADLKAVEKETSRAVKDAKSRVDTALAIGSDTVDSVKGPDGTVALTSLTLTTPHGTRDLSPAMRAEAETTGSLPASEEDVDDRKSTLRIVDGDHTESYDFKPDQEAAVRGLAARITSAAGNVGEVVRQREESTAEAEAAVAAANEQATVRLNDAQARYDRGLAESEEKVRAAEVKARDSRIR